MSQVSWDNWRFERQNIKDTDKILEIGCGTGKFWINNAKELSRTSMLILTDISEDFVNSARNILSQNENVHFKTADIFNLPFPQDSFDSLICDFVLHILANKGDALKEMRRVVNDEGIIGISTFCCKHKSKYWDMANGVTPEN